MSSEEIAAEERPAPGDRPAAVTVAAGGTIAEAGVLAVAGAAWLVQVVVQGSSALGVAAFLILFAWGLAAVLVAGARALRRGSRRARGPVITWQLLQVATALAVLQVPGRPGWLAAGAAVAIVVAVTVVAALLVPRSVTFATH